MSDTDVLPELVAVIAKATARDFTQRWRPRTAVSSQAVASALGHTSSHATSLRW
jgi:hypothetical protein